MKKKLIAGVLTVLMVLSVLPGVSMAASKKKTVKMPAYSDVMKVGKNTVYCAGVKGLYRVKLKKGKVKSVKLMVKQIGGDIDPYRDVNAMKKYGKYIYYRTHPDGGTYAFLYKMKISNGKKKKIALDSFGDLPFAIRSNKIYYSGYADDEETYYQKVMNTDGSKKKNTSVKPVTQVKATNAKGYAIKMKEDKKYVRDYLITPKGTFCLGKTKNIWKD